MIILHFGQGSGANDISSGCIGQKYSTNGFVVAFVPEEFAGEDEGVAAGGAAIIGINVMPHTGQRPGLSYLIAP